MPSGNKSVNYFSTVQVPTKFLLLLYVVLEGKRFMGRPCPQTQLFKIVWGGANRQWVPLNLCAAILCFALLELDTGSACFIQTWSHSWCQAVLCNMHIWKLPAFPAAVNAGYEILKMWLIS